jgi:hypothetical protein
MFGKSFGPALAARALKDALAKRLNTSPSASRQAPRGRPCARTRVADARYVAPDADWFASHPERMYRLRVALPDDPADCAPSAICCCRSRYETDRVRHRYRILVRRTSERLLYIKLPTCRFWPPPSEGDELLAKVFAYLATTELRRLPHLRAE